MLDKGQIERGGMTTRGILPTKVLRLADKETLPIPLPYTSAKMWVSEVKGPRNGRNLDVRTRLLACLFACLLVLLTHLLAPHFSLRSLTHS